MPDTTGPWWVEDQETGHRFVTHELAEHLHILHGETPWTDGGALRPAEPKSTTPKAEEAAA